ncbi:MAG: glycosyltransferase [Spirochaetales bacterium]|nr:glycosyltransferase [Leptospiraceae bacterium]MCP5482098.1 glycosyltransferase [Spirochaetales bacterium]MCP5484946.1 glycosyltransferase [Spirochaetales bacterium]
MKILHLGRFLDENNGGLEQTVIDLLDALSEEVSVENLVAHRRFRLRSEVDIFHGWKVYRTASLGMYFSTAFSFPFPFRLRRLYRKEHYDIVHLHFPDPLSCLSALLLPRTANIVISWHSDVIRQRGFLKFYQPFVNRLLSRTRAVVGATPAHFTDSTQLQVLPDSKKYVIPFAVDVQRFDSSDRISRKSRELKSKHAGRFLVFALGRHVYYKGFEYLIQAVRSLPNAVILLGGSGPITGELKQAARELGVSDRVVFTGRLSEEEMLAHYHACDVFCLPSVEKAEAFGVVQIEAMLCKKPVVCFDLKNGVTYVNQHMQTGLVVPLRDVEALAEALRELQEKPALRLKLGRQGRKRAIREFSKESTRRRMLALYRSIVNETSGA